MSSKKKKRGTKEGLENETEQESLPKKPKNSYTPRGGVSWSWKLPRRPSRKHTASNASSKSKKASSESNDASSESNDASSESNDDVTPDNVAADEAKSTELPSSWTQFLSIFQLGHHEIAQAYKLFQDSQKDLDSKFEGSRIEGTEVKQSVLNKYKACESKFNLAELKLYNALADSSEALCKTCPEQKTSVDAGVAIINAGGTIGMVVKEGGEDLVTKPNNLLKEMAKIPGLRDYLDSRHKYYELMPLIDSSNATPWDWMRLASVVIRFLVDPSVKGVVVAHGTDTLSYTAAALTFLIRNLNKPVIVTGAQLPLGYAASDGIDHLYYSCLIADQHKLSPVLLPEVCVYFRGKVMVGSRVEKVNANGLDAFDSPKSEYLATRQGAKLVWNMSRVNKIKTARILSDNRSLKTMTELIPVISKEPSGCAVLVKLLGQFPVTTLVQLAPGNTLRLDGFDGIVIKAYGVGNGPTGHFSFVQSIRRACQTAIIGVVTECLRGEVEQTYETGFKDLTKTTVGQDSSFNSSNIVMASDMTSEACYAKLVILLWSGKDKKEIPEALAANTRGEGASSPDDPEDLKALQKHVAESHETNLPTVFDSVVGLLARTRGKKHLS